MMLITLLLVALAMANKDESASGLLARLEERRNIGLGLHLLSSSTSSSDSAPSQNNDPNDDDDDRFSTSYSDTTTSSTTERIAARILRNEEEEKKRLAAIRANKAKAAATKRAVYQAKFTRDNSAAGLCPTQTVTAQNNITSCVLAEFGPVVIIGKTSPGSVLDDVFDGDLDGKLDVRDAFEELSRVNGSTTLVSFDPVKGENGENVNRLSDFLFEIRNRADVNGGSINLTSLILTGRVGNGENPLPFPNPDNANEAPAFQTFGNGKTLISPCFSVPLDVNFNIELFAVIKGFNGLISADIPGTRLFQLNGSVPVDFLPKVTIDNVLLPTNATTSPAVTGLVGPQFLVAGVSVGTVTFESCEQFSYFH